MSEEKAFCRTDDLAIGYGKTPLMEHIRLGAEKGSILTLIGPNGAGKSTLLKTLAAQLAPQGGAVLLDGKSLADYSGPERARKMALMVPHTRRTELTTCFEMASAGRYPYTGRLGVLSAEDRRQVHAALALVGAEALAGRDFNCISDGQRQRVLLARAICQQPELILLDEPTSFLDIKGKAELLAILKSLARDKKMAVILSLHELELAQKISDKVVCVSAAGVSDVMTPGQAFARENICKIYDLSDEQYAFLYGEAKKPAETGQPRFEHYVRSGQKLLRCGYTTGTCAGGGGRSPSPPHRPRPGDGGPPHPEGHRSEGGADLLPPVGRGGRVRHPQRRRRRCGRDHRPAGHCRCDPPAGAGRRGPCDKARPRPAGGRSRHQPHPPGHDKGGAGKGGGVCRICGRLRCHHLHRGRGRDSQAHLQPPHGRGRRPQRPRHQRHRR